MTDVLAQAAHLAQADSPLAAMQLLLSVTDRELTPEEAALRDQLGARMAHLTTKEKYAAFYDTQVEERPWMALDHVPHCALSMPRLGVVRAQMELQGHRRVLDLACFDAFFSLNLGLAGMEVVGIDLNRAAVAEASRRAGLFKVNCQFLPGFLEEANVGRQFDSVLLLEILEHVGDIGAALAAAERHLIPGGRVYISAPLTAPNHQHEREAREHVRLIDFPAMMQLLNGDHRRLRWYTQLKTPDGLHHCGSYEPVTA